jgi:general secretion pathway protein A
VRRRSVGSNGYRPGLVLADLVGRIADDLAACPIAKRKSAIIMIDEAEHAGGDVLCGLHELFSGDGAVAAAVSHIILCGRSELASRVELPSFASLRACRVADCTLERLNDRDVAAYIWHRLRRAGCRDLELFSAAAIDVVIAHASGLPREINLLCARSLALAASRNQLSVDAETVVHVLRPTQRGPCAAPAGLRHDARSQLSNCH